MKNLEDMTDAEARELVRTMSVLLSPLLPEDACFTLLLSTAGGELHVAGDGREDRLPEFLRACALVLEEDDRLRRAAKGN